MPIFLAKSFILPRMFWCRYVLPFYDYFDPQMLLRWANSGKGIHPVKSFYVPPHQNFPHHTVSHDGDDEHNDIDSGASDENLKYKK